MKTILRTGCAVLILAICMSCLLSFGTGTAWAETPEETVTLPGLTWPVERAEGPTAESYPYILRTESAVWHLSADDMELQGEEEYCASLELLLQDLDADFAEARELLAPWIWEEIPPIDIYTDFCGHAEGDEIFGAIYFGARREIRLFHDWNFAARSLLHEYVHYLTITCTDRPVSEGLFAEGVAEYVSHFACRNGMDREASKRALSPEEKKLAGEWNLLDEDGCMDPARTYLYNAEVIRSPGALGAKYNTITNAVMTREERLNQSPGWTTISYYEAGCFLAFLVESYGEETVFSHWDLDPAELESVFGKDFSALYGDWVDWNRMQCIELGISFG